MRILLRPLVVALEVVVLLVRFARGVAAAGVALTEEEHVSGLDYLATVYGADLPYTKELLE